MRSTPWRQATLKAFIKSLEGGKIPTLARTATEVAEPVIYNELCAEYYGPLEPTRELDR